MDNYTAITVTCKTGGCLNHATPITIKIPADSPHDGVVCGGGCENLIHPANEIIAEPEPTINELIEQKLRELGVIQ